MSCKYTNYSNDSTVKNGGFTIIETLIVLAIAGLILLLVFLAITQLQRTGVNTERDADATKVLQLMSEYMLNNSGNLPLAACGPIVGPTPTSSICSTSETDLNALNGLTTVYLSNSSENDINILPTDESDATNLTTSAVFPTAADEASWLSIYNYAICDITGNNITTITGAGYNSLVAIYAIENGSSYDIKCQQLH